MGRAGVTGKQAGKQELQVGRQVSCRECLGWLLQRMNGWLHNGVHRQVPCEGGHLEHGLVGAADWCYGVWAGEKMAGVNNLQQLVDSHLNRDLGDAITDFF